jgi:hypothetical protein
MASSVEQRDEPWVVFAGMMLIITGILSAVNGLWALDHRSDKESALPATQLLWANLEKWGWIMLIWGIIVIIAGFLVFGRSQLGRWIGILAASIVIIVNMTWVFAFSWAALVEILLGTLVLFALIVYGGRETSTA